MTPVDRDIIRAEASVAWVSLSPSDQAVVRFGMIPSHLVATHANVIGSPDGLRQFAVELMGCAQRNGGMIA